MSESNLRKVPLHVATPHPLTPKQALFREQQWAESILLEEKRRALEEKVKEDRKKLMESFQAILGLQVGSIIAAIIGIAGLGLFNENFQSKMILALLFTTLIITISSTFTHTVKVKESLRFISAMTCLVTILCAGIFHFAIFLITPEDKVYTLLNAIIFFVECLFIVLAWNNHFPIP